MGLVFFFDAGRILEAERYSRDGDISGYLDGSLAGFEFFPCEGLEFFFGGAAKRAVKTMLDLVDWNFKKYIIYDIMGLYGLYF